MKCPIGELEGIPEGLYDLVDQLDLDPPIQNKENSKQSYLFFYFAGLN